MAPGSSPGQFAGRTWCVGPTFRGVFVEGGLNRPRNHAKPEDLAYVTGEQSYLKAVDSAHAVGPRGASVLRQGESSAAGPTVPQAGGRRPRRGRRIAATNLANPIIAYPFLIHGGLPYGAMFGAPGAASGGI